MAEFEAAGEVEMPEGADADLLVYVSVDARWHAKKQTKIPLPGSLGPDWKAVRVSSVGGHLIVSIDGAVIGQVDVPAGAYGRIGFDVTRGRLSVRDWRVVRLDAAGAPRTLVALNPDLGLTDASAREVTDPKLLREQRPQYTRAAMQSRVEGGVELEAVIERDGSVSEVRIVKPLVDDLDRQAEKAVRHWRFDPARLHGTPVRTRASVLLWFTLK